MAEQNQDTQERTEEATPKRLQEAREKGQIPRSRELGTFAVLFVSGIGLLLLGGGMVDQALRVARTCFSIHPEAFAGELPLLAYLEAAIIDAVVSLLPFFALTAVVAILAPLALGGWAFSPSALAFKWEKLDPVKGLGRVFSSKGAMELAKALGKFVLVAGVAVFLIWTTVDEMLGIGAEAVVPAIADAAGVVMRDFLVLSLALVVIVLVDVPFQIWSHAKQLRMSHQEVKEEFKETEGKPEVKRRVRELQREASQRRMMEEVPKADVVVTNPTHVAVALRYDPERMNAPRLVAKGGDQIALRIREVAGTNDVPILESPLLARAVFRTTELNQEIPAGLYTAVAQVLAYVYQLRHRDPGTATPAPPDPEVPGELLGDAP